MILVKTFHHRALLKAYEAEWGTEGLRMLRQEDLKFKVSYGHVIPDPVSKSRNTDSEDIFKNMVWLIDNRLKQLSAQTSIEEQGIRRKEGQKDGKEKWYVLIHKSIVAVRKKMAELWSTGKIWNEV